MPYPAKAIANYFLDLARREGKPLSPMKIQKLVYYAHGWNLAIRGEPLVNEQIEAWTWGPVVPRLYRALKHCGNGPVAEKLRAIKYEDCQPHTYVPVIGDKSDPSGETRELLRKVWETYSDYTAIQLSNLTHEPGSPWDQINSKYEGNIPNGTDIPPDMIRDYFVSMAAK